jgi:hypothetical protein
MGQKLIGIIIVSYRDYYKEISYSYTILLEFVPKSNSYVIILHNENNPTQWK